MARDTPGRDAYAMRMAARKKSGNMFGQREPTDDLKAAVAAKIRNKQYVTPAERMKLQKAGAFGLKGSVGKAVKFGLDVTGVSAIPQTVNDAYWSFTHPKDRVLGRGRAKHQTMAWVGPSRLRPSWRVATENPEWEIIRNKDRDVVVGLGGRTRYSQPPPRSWGMARNRRNFERAYDLPESLPERQWQIDHYRSVLLDAAERSRNHAIDFAFSAVPAGTREAHASMGMLVGRDKTYVDWLARLTDPDIMFGERRRNLGAGASYGPDAYEYLPRDVPPNVMMQLAANALSPEKPLESWVINDRLRAVIQKYARMHGIDFTQAGPAGRLGGR